MKTIELNANIRKESGKGPARRLREEGLIPAVFYGPGTETISLTIDSSDLAKSAKKGRIESAFIKLAIEDNGGKIEKLSMIKELQVNPLTRNPLHIDFYGIRMDHTLAMDIPIQLTGQSIGIEAGGDLQFSKRNLRLSALPSLLPDFIEVDISELEIGDSVKVGDVVLGEEIEILDPANVMIVAVVVTRIAEVEVAEEEVEELPEGEGEETGEETGQETGKETTE